MLAQVQQNLPAGSGFAYRFLAAGGDTQRQEVGVSVQNEIGTYSIEAANSAGDMAYRGSISGGAALMGGKVFLSRRLADSFAVVNTPDYAGVRVYADNQLVALDHHVEARLLGRAGHRSNGQRQRAKQRRPDPPEEHTHD